MDHPDAERERAIVLARVPEASERLAAHVVRAVGTLRGMGLCNPPSIAESIDSARAVLALGLDTLDDSTAAASLGVVLEHDTDQERAAEALGIGASR